MNDMDALFSAAKERFEAITEVDAVYHCIENGQAYLYLFTRNEEYDERLLRTLIGIEQEFMDLFPNVNQIYRYFPNVLIDNQRDVVPYSASILFSRMILEKDGD